MSDADQVSSRGFATIAELIHLHAVKDGKVRALVQDDQAMSYVELDEFMDRTASALTGAGLEVGDRVAFVSASTLNYAAAFMGVLRAGGVPVPIAPSSTPEQIRSMIVDSGARYVYVDADAEPVVRDVAKVLFRLDRPDEWLAASDASLTLPDIGPESAFNIIYSSGTTGMPKGILHTHAMRWAQIVAYAGAGFTGSVTVVATPLYSNTTLVSLLPTMAYGGTAVLMSKFDALNFLRVAERERATHVMLVPVQYQRIMAVPEFSDFDLTSFRFKSCTSAPFSAELKADVVRRWSGQLVEIYGMTEGGASCVLYANAFPDKLHTVGPPAPGHEIRLIDEQGQEVAKGEVGEVVGRSGVMMVGYHGRPDASRESEWHDENGNRFIRHGDLGRLDEDGFLTLLGRSKDMIISGGFNIYPSDIENVMAMHPDVADATVIGIPSQEWGESPYAFYVPSRTGVVTDDVVTWVNERVGRTQRLSGGEAIPELPRSAIGKVLKRELRLRFETARTVEPEQNAETTRNGIQ